MVYGSSGTGKSTFIANLLLRNFDGLQDIYLPKNIFVFAQNGMSDASFRAVIMKLKKIDPEWDNFSPELDTAKLRGIIARQKKLFDDRPSERLRLKN
jgi:hypothetical protein